MMNALHAPLFVIMSFGLLHLSWLALLQAQYANVSLPVFFDTPSSAIPSFAQASMREAVLLSSGPSETFSIMTSLSRPPPRPTVLTDGRGFLTYPWIDCHA